MLSNGWYWSDGDKRAMAYPMTGWDIRCNWEQDLSGKWFLTLSITEDDPAPWIPGTPVNAASIRIRPQIGETRLWDSPDPATMEEMSRRTGLKRMLQATHCIRTGRDFND